MTKKKLIVFALLFIIVNVYIIKFIKFESNADILLKMNVLSNEADTYQVFYSYDDTYKEDLSIKSEYINVNQEQELTFTIPYDTKYIRIDFGTKLSDIEINNIYFIYDNRKLQFNNDLIINSSYHMISSIKSLDDRLLLTTVGNDPFCVVDITSLHLDNFVHNQLLKSIILKKVLLGIFISLFLLFIVKKSEKLISLIFEIYKNRNLILNLSLNDFKTKYAGSYFGIIWAFVQPVVTVLVYWFVFQIGFKAALVNNYPFVLWLVLGLVPWFFFSEAITGGTNSMLEYSYLVKKVVFPISILPIIKVISALFVHLFFIGFTLVLFIAYGFMPDLYVLQIIYYSICMFVLILGITYLSSSIIVFFKDLGQFINIFLQVGMWMTPIVWNYTIIPEEYRLIFKLNPMYYIIEGYRDSLINKIWFWEKINSSLYFWIIAMGIFGAGAVVFKRLKVHFADVL